jgi:HlyD family secretion protein
VLEVMTEKGKLLNRGEPVLSLDLTGQTVQNLVAIIYVPSIHGKKVRPGMEVNVAPSTVPPEKYGMMVGRVTLVSDYPATPKGMLRVLKNDQLVRELSGGGAPYEVHAELVVDPSTRSSYRWTSSDGPPATIESGTVATGFFTLRSERPIARVIPLLREWTGT